MVVTVELPKVSELVILLVVMFETVDTEALPIFSAVGMPLVPTATVVVTVVAPRRSLEPILLAGMVVIVVTNG